MKHPSTRAARRYARDVYRTYRRSIMKNWGAYSNRQGEDWITGNLWWHSCGKNNGAHGCRMCKFEKYDRKCVRKRRRALDHEIQLNLLSFTEPR